jgi:hypothetical protein
MGWDSNPRYACTYGGFQDRYLKPLGHPSRSDNANAYHAKRWNQTAYRRAQARPRSRETQPPPLPPLCSPRQS